jgi:hypothetical protein
MGFIKKIMKNYFKINNINSIYNIKLASKIFFTILIICLVYVSCKKDKEEEPAPSDNLALDSIVTTKRTIVVWEEILITAYARGKNLNFLWSANHGSMDSKDSVTVKYWGCNSCIGLNTIECKVSNEYGTVSDTIMIQVNQ